MPKKKTRKKPQSRPLIHHPHELLALIGETDLKALKSRVNRRIGACGVCHETLGKKQDLAMVIAAAGGINLGDLSGAWQVTLTHRTCHKEAVVDTADLTPRHTYTTTLMALPVMSTDGFPQQVPTLLVNPSVDHFAVLKQPDGTVVDRMIQHLVDEVGFTPMRDGATQESEQLEAYVTGANVTVAANDHGVSWTHEQAGDPDVRDHLGRSLKTLLTAWDDTLLVMASTRFRSNDPRRLLQEIPDLISEGSVYGAPAKVEYSESNLSLVDKAFTAATGFGADE